MTQSVSSGWILIQEGNRWSAGCLRDGRPLLWEIEATVELPTAASHESSQPAKDWATAVAQVLTSQGYRGEDLLLAVDSAACLVGTIPLSRPGLARDRQALAYELEQGFPLAAEELVADFLTGDQSALGIAIPHAACAPAVAALEELGIRIASISPTALVALAHAHRTNEWEPDCLVLWEHGGQIEAFRIKRNRLHAWSWFPVDAAALVRHAQWSALNHSGSIPCHCINLSEPVATALSAAVEITLEQYTTTSLSEMGIHGAAAILSGTATPWIEFRRDTLASRERLRAIHGPVQFALASALACLISLAMAFQWQGAKYEERAQEFQKRQESLYSELYPNQPIPSGIRGRLESEHSRVAGLQANEPQVRNAPSAVGMLHDAMTALPGDLRYRFSEIRIERANLSLDGEVLTHGTANAIAGAMQSHGFTVAPPKTQQLTSGGIATRIQATRTQTMPTVTPVATPRAKVGG